MFLQAVIGQYLYKNMTTCKKYCKLTSRQVIVLKLPCSIQTLILSDSLHNYILQLIKNIYFCCLSNF